MFPSHSGGSDATRLPSCPAPSKKATETAQHFFHQIDFCDALSKRRNQNVVIHADTVNLVNRCFGTNVVNKWLVVDDAAAAAATVFVIVVLNRRMQRHSELSFIILNNLFF